MPMAANEIERLIKAGIPDAEVTIRDLAGDGDHYAARVVSKSFAGVSRIKQHHPQKRSGPAPVLAATDAFGCTSS